MLVDKGAMSALPSAIALFVEIVLKGMRSLMDIG
jgi:hypothetical protein